MQLCLGSLGLSCRGLAWNARRVEALLDKDLADAVEKQKLRNKFWVIPMLLTVARSPLKQWSSAPTMVFLEAENP